MKGADLYKAIGSVSEQHVADTFQYFRMRKRMKLIKIASIAAALCLVIPGAVLIALHKIAVSDPSGNLIEENGFLIRDGELLRYTGDETDVVIPESVDSIADNAFADARDINTVTLTANVKHVGYDAFNGEKGIRLLLSADNRYFTDTGGSIISTDGTNLLQYIGGEQDSYQIPDGVKQIGAFAFYEAKIDEIIFPKGLVYIGKGAFSGCSLRAIYLPDSVEYVGMWAFSECIRAVDGSVPKTAEIGEDAFFHVPFYTSMLAGHSCPGEDVQRGTVTPSEALIKNAHLQEINDAVLEFIQKGYMCDYGVERSEICFPDFTQKIEIKNAEFADGVWGEEVECRAKIYITDQQYVSIGLVCMNPYDCARWEDAEWRICRAEFYPDTYEVQKDGLTLTFFRDADTLNYILQEIGYNGGKYDTKIDRAVLSPEVCEYKLQKITDGLYVLCWDTYENSFDRNLYYYGNTSRGYIDYQVYPTLTAIDLRSGDLKLTHYLNEIEEYSFWSSINKVQEDGLYKLMLRDYNYLLIDWVKYLAGEGGITLYEFETVTIDDVADIDKLYNGNTIGFVSSDYELDMLQAFITKDTAALEEYSCVSSGTYDLYKSLKFGEYTITGVLSDPELGLYYEGNRVFLDVDVLKSDIPEIPVGKHCFVVESGPGGYYVVDRDRKRFIAVHPDLKELDNFASLLHRCLGNAMEIPDVDTLTEEELELYKETVISYILDYKSYDYNMKIEDVIYYAEKLFNVAVLPENIINGSAKFFHYVEGDRVYVRGHGGSTTGMDILERKNWGNTITVTIRFYAEGSLTIPAKDIKYTLTKTPDGLAFFTPSEVIRDYGRPVWGFTV